MIKGDPVRVTQDKQQWYQSRFQEMDGDQYVCVLIKGAQAGELVTVPEDCMLPSGDAHV